MIEPGTPYQFTHDGRWVVAVPVVCEEEFVMDRDQILHRRYLFHEQTAPPMEGYYWRRADQVTRYPTTEIPQP
jgi:hypothetical protein